LVIRCERCSTLYELDEALLAPDGSPVQCTRCDHVFTVRPPRPSDSGGVRPSALELENAAAAIDAASSTAAEPPPAPRSVAQSAAGNRTTPAPRPESLGPRAPAHEPRYARGAAPSVYRPTPGPGAVRAHPVLRRDTVGAFESRLRFTARLRWLAPAVALGVIVLGAASGWFFLRGRAEPSAASPRAEGLSRVAAPRDAEPLGGARPPSDGSSQGPHAQPPVGPPPGKATSPSGKTVAQGSAPAAFPGDAPSSPSAERTPQPEVAASQPSRPAAPIGAPPGSAPASVRGDPPSALQPASIPDVAPASGMPQIAPPEVPEGARRHSREPAALEDPVSGG
jgi:predicted Zn finger-like uncharacterized protein